MRGALTPFLPLFLLRPSRITLLACAILVACALPAPASPQHPTSRPEGARGLHRPVTLDLRDVPLATALREISEQAGLRLTYSSAMLPRGKRVTLRAERISVDEAVARVLAGTDLEFVTTGTGQAAIVRRRVPPPSAARPTPTRPLALTNRIVELPEVVAIGYGTARRRDLTGAIESVRGRELPPEGAPSPSLSTSLAGRVAGVQIVTNGGAPGSSASLQIRGIQSISARSEPLYVVDGVPISPGGTDLTTGTPLSAIDPNNIESVQILKDASATAIYGARGANGVVLITTRRGQQGEARIAVESSYGIQRPTRFIEALDAQEYRTLVNEGLTNVGLAPRYTPEQIAEARTFDYPRALLNDLEWQLQQNHAVTISGGDDRTRYLLFANHLDQKGIVVNSGYARSGARVNLDRTVTPRFRMGASLSGTQSRQELNGADDTGNGAFNTGITTAIQYDPAVFPYDSVTGTWNQRVVLNENFLNPYTEAVNRSGSDRVTALLTSAYGEVDLLSHLTLRGQVGGNFNFSRSQSFSPSFIGSGNNLGTATQSSSERRELTSSTTLQLRREVGRGVLDALVGVDLQTSAYEIVTAESRGFPADQLEFYDLGAGSTIIGPTSNRLDWTLLSQLARVNYNLLDRYLFTVTARRDGSSRFGANDKWAFFPSAAFSWRVIDEPFLRNRTLLSDLKFRLSYGRTGNQAINPYQSLEQLTTIFVARGTGSTVVTLAPDAAVGNPDLKWETQDQLNVGLELGVLENRLTLTVDAYESSTSNLLLNTQQLWVTGVSNQLRNVGAVRNRGVEFSLQTVNWEGDRFAWTSSLNLSRNVNEVTELYRGLRSLGAGSSIQVGEPLNTFVGYRVLGLWSIQDSITGACPFTAAECRPGEYRILDADGNGRINDDDRVILGSGQADFYGGFTSNMSYGPLSLDAFFNFSVGNEINAQPFNRFLGLVGGASNERRDRALRRWTPQNQDTDVPRANITRSVNPTYSTYIEDGSFLRLQNLTLGCDLPARLVPGEFLGAARLTLTGQNLWITTRYSGFDPENAASNGQDTGGYPKAKAWNLGLHLTF